MEPVGGRIRLRILVDRTSIEVFGNGGKVSLTSCYLARPRERSVQAFAVGGPARIVSCETWTLRSAWTDEARRAAEKLAR